MSRLEFILATHIERKKEPVEKITNTTLKVCRCGHCGQRYIYHVTGEISRCCGHRMEDWGFPKDLRIINAIGEDQWLANLTREDCIQGAKALIEAIDTRESLDRAYREGQELTREQVLQLRRNQDIREPEEVAEEIRGLVERLINTAYVGRRDLQSPECMFEIQTTTRAILDNLIAQNRIIRYSDVYVNYNINGNINVNFNIQPPYALNWITISSSMDLSDPRANSR